MLVSHPSAIYTAAMAAAECSKLDLDSYADEPTFLVEYFELYLKTPAAWLWLYYALLATMIVGLFYLLYTIADRHLTWSLQHLSVYCRLSPDLAGMTFLAFGNGAPDFFTALSGGQKVPAMILGSSIGAGLFIVTIVLGAVILAGRNGEKERRKDIEANPTAPVADEQAHHVTPFPFIRNSLLYLTCVGFLAIFGLRGQLSLWQPIVLLVIYAVYISTVIGMHYYVQVGRAKRLVEHQQRKPVDPEKVSLEPQVREAYDRLAALPFHRRCWSALRTAYKAEGRDVWRKLAYLLQMPFELVLNLTIPPLEIPEEECEGGEEIAALRFVHRIRTITSPLFSLAMLVLLLAPELPAGSPPYHWIIYAAIAPSLAILFWFTTSWDRPPCWYPAHVAYAFAMCIVWIYATSNELVAALNAFGLLAGVSNTIMGIVVLAWGNSFGDLVTDVATSRNGALETAVSAVFSAPMQNVLLTIGTSFTIATLRAPNKIVAFDVGYDIYIALACLAFAVIVTIVLVPLCRFRLPKYLGIGLIALYCTYLPIGILAGMGFFSRFSS